MIIFESLPGSHHPSSLPEITTLLNSEFVISVILIVFLLEYLHINIKEHCFADLEVFYIILQLVFFLSRMVLSFVHVLTLINSFKLFSIPWPHLFSTAKDLLKVQCLPSFHPPPQDWVSDFGARWVQWSFLCFRWANPLLRYSFH